MPQLHKPTDYKKLTERELLVDRDRLMTYIVVADLMTLEPYRRGCDREGPDFEALLPSYYINRVTNTSNLVRRAKLLVDKIDEELERRRSH
jgi:hypothetical protein